MEADSSWQGLTGGTRVGRLGRLMRRGCRRELTLKGSCGGKGRTRTRYLLVGMCAGAVKTASLMLGTAIDTSAASLHTGAVSAGACAVTTTAHYCWRSSIRDTWLATNFPLLSLG